MAPIFSLLERICREALPTFHSSASLAMLATGGKASDPVAYGTMRAKSLVRMQLCQWKRSCCSGELVYLVAKKASSANRDASKLDSSGVFLCCCSCVAELMQQQPWNIDTDLVFTSSYLCCQKFGWQTAACRQHVHTGVSGHFTQLHSATMSPEHKVHPWGRPQLLT